MKTFFFVAFISLFLQGCSNPFGPNSLIETISNGIGNVFFGKASSSLVAGGAQKFQTANSYNGSVSVGNFINQNQTVTNGGYTVKTSIKSTQ